MNKDKNQFMFRSESQHKIGGTTYQIFSFFDESSEELFPIVKRLLQKAVETEISQLGQHVFSNSII